jgi:hypothetical protein
VTKVLKLLKNKKINNEIVSIKWLISQIYILN